MAKKKLSQKERKRQEKARKRAVRQHTGWQEPPRPKWGQQANLMAPLIDYSQEKTVEKMFQAVYNSDILVDEPELEDLLFDPLPAAGHFIKEAEAQGWSPEELYALPQAQRSEAMEGILVAILPDLWTQTAQKAVLDRLDNLLTRLQNEKKTEKAAQTAVTRMLLADHKQEKMWPDVPLLLALAARSVDAGFTWMGAMEEVAQSPDEWSPQSILASAAGQKLASLIAQNPELRRLAETEVDKAWEKGLEALHSGEMNLQLFTEDELEAGGEVLWKHLGEDESTGKRRPFNAQALVDDLSAYFKGNLTPDRLAAMQQQAERVANSASLERKYRPFLLMVADTLASEDVLETEWLLLFTALLNEVNHAAAAREETGG